MRKGIIMLLQKGFQPIFGGGIVALILREEQESTRSFLGAYYTQCGQILAL